jgi:DNA modification methylase
LEKQLLGSIELNRIYQMDCAEGMRLLPEGSVDLTVTSPPYDNLRTYNGYSFDFEKIAQELYRVTKSGGVVVWVVGDATINGSETGTSFRQALYFKEIGFSLHDTMIYLKTKPTPQAQHPRYQPAFEYMFVFCKGYPPKTFNPLKEPTKHTGKVVKTNGQRNADNTFRHKNGKLIEIRKEKTRSNVWAYSNFRPSDMPKDGHPAIFPEALASDHILSWSNPGDIVLDPFMGSGTTAKMAILTGRNFVGFEISREYIEIANKRLEAALAEKEGGHDA